jgi:hypothetical protein
LQRTPLARSEALATLARRYFRSRGPALLDDFTWWSGLTAADARTALESIRPSLVSDVVEGRTYFRWDSSTSVAPAKDVCHLLPAFDEYLVAYRNRDALLDPSHVKHMNAGGGMLNASVVADGRVIGTWRRELVRGGADLEIDLFQPPTRKQQRVISAATERFGQFLGLEARIARLSAHT